MLKDLKSFWETVIYMLVHIKYKMEDFKTFFLEIFKQDQWWRLEKFEEMFAELQC